MRYTGTSVRLGNARKGTPKRWGLLAVARRAILVLFCFGLGGVAGIAAFMYYLAADLPAIGPLLEGYDPPQVTRVFAADGTVIGELFVERRTVVPVDHIPKVMIDAVIAAEDADFRRHAGLDYLGMARAVVANVMRGRLAQGGSTITQQVARTFFLTRQKTFARKLREILLTVRIEKRLTKDEILYLYLNQINFGHGRYGVGEAARFYFGKEIRDVTLAEAALLAAIPKGPSIYEPIGHPEAARARRGYVLGEMAKHGLVSSARAELAQREPLGVAASRGWDEHLAPEAAAEALRELAGAVDEEALRHGGYAIETTVDPALQRAARGAVVNGIDAWKTRHQRELARSKDGAVPQSALVAVDPATGRIVALVGGGAVEPGGFDRATSAHRQPGSAFKPFVYLEAIRSRRYTAASLVDDSPEVDGSWRPQDAHSGAFAGAVSMRDALARSLNLPAVKVIRDVGPQAVADLARQLGVESPLDPGPALALGSSAVSPAELVAGYAALAAGGLAREPWIVSRVRGPDGADIPLLGRAGTRVVTEEEAYIVTSMLTSVIEYGTGADALALGRPAAGKTGTTNDAKDAWFAGYTPDVVAVVWVGFDDARSLGPKEYGGRAALPIWLEFMKRAEAGLPVRDFAVPPGVVTATVDPATGLLAFEGQGGAREEVFIDGTVPTETALPPDAVSLDAFLLEQAVGRSRDAGVDAGR
jgi:penicillin-binding protein 1A